MSGEPPHPAAPLTETGAGSSWLAMLGWAGVAVVCAFVYHKYSQSTSNAPRPAPSSGPSQRERRAAKEAALARFEQSLTEPSTSSPSSTSTAPTAPSSSTAPAAPSTSTAPATPSSSTAPTAPSTSTAPAAPSTSTAPTAPSTSTAPTDDSSPTTSTTTTTTTTATTTPTTPSSSSATNPTATTTPTTPSSPPATTPTATTTPTTPSSPPATTPPATTPTTPQTPSTPVSGRDLKERPLENTEFTSSPLYQCVLAAHAALPLHDARIVANIFELLNGPLANQLIPDALVSHFSEGSLSAAAVAPVCTAYAATLSDPRTRINFFHTLFDALADVPAFAALSEHFRRHVCAQIAELEDAVDAGDDARTLESLTALLRLCHSIYETGGGGARSPTTSASLGSELRASQVWPVLAASDHDRIRQMAASVFALLQEGVV